MELSTENEVKAKVIEYLKHYEAMGKIIFWMRIFTGTLSFHGRFIHGAPNGTPDFLFIRSSGTVVWVETKKLKEKLRDAQEVFKTKISKAPGNVFYRISDPEDILKIV
jgi:hypothetical protein